MSCYINIDVNRMIRGNEFNFENQVKKMVAFIEQEGKEWSQEILSRADEEYNLMVGRLVQTSRIQIMRQCEKKEKQVAKSRIIQMSSLYTEARARILRVRYEHVRRVIQEVKKSLILSTGTHQYHRTLYNLILQGLLKMNVRCDVLIIAAKRDLNIVKNSISSIQSEYCHLTGAKSKLMLSKTTLQEREIGGIELYTFDDRIRVRNTLRSRLIQVTERMIPLIRYGLYGLNPHRKSLT